MVRLIMRVLLGALFMGTGSRSSRAGSAATASRAPASSSRASGCGRASATPRPRARRDGGRRAPGARVPDARRVGRAHRDDGDGRQDVHLEKGPWVSEGGWEYNAVIVAALAALTETGPGRCPWTARSARSCPGRSGPSPALAAGLGGAAANLTMSEDAPQTVASAPADVAERRGPGTCAGPPPRRFIPGAARCGDLEWNCLRKSTKSISLHHAAHLGHPAAAAGAGGLRDLGHDGLGGQDVLRDRRGVLQRGARDHRRVDHAGL